MCTFIKIKQCSRSSAILPIENVEVSRIVGMRIESWVASGYTSLEQREAIVHVTVVMREAVKNKVRR